MVEFPRNRQVTLDAYHAYAGGTGKWVKRKAWVNTYDIGGQPVRVVSIHPKRPDWAKQVHQRLQALFAPAEETAEPHQKIPTVFAVSPNDLNRLRGFRWQSVHFSNPNTPNSPKTFGWKPAEAVMHPSSVFVPMLQAGPEVIPKPNPKNFATRPVVDAALRLAAKRMLLKGRIMTHGAVLAVPVDGPNGKPQYKGIAIFGPSGVGKTELMIDLVRNGAKIVADDAVVLHKGRMAGPDKRQTALVSGPNMAALLGFKRKLPPEIRNNLARHFIEVSDPMQHNYWQYLRLDRAVASSFFGEDVAHLDEVYHPHPVPLDTVVFMLPLPIGNRTLERDAVYNVQVKKNADIQMLGALLRKGAETHVAMALFPQLNRPASERILEYPNGSQPKNLRTDLRAEQRPTKRVLSDYLARASAQMFGIQPDPEDIRGIIGDVRAFYTFGTVHFPRSPAFLSDQLIGQIREGKWPKGQTSTSQDQRNSMDKGNYKGPERRQSSRKKRKQKRKEEDRVATKKWTREARSRDV
ncbi:hypothetical protein HY994_06540 [Candidatus Micrarchaeota archaeon]|nr:hypothetical protein [Candidatus Micrarchaeota archaeon]